MRHKSACTALAVFCLGLFVLAGCAAMLEKLGMSPQEAAESAEKMGAAAVETARRVGGPAGELIALAVATAGAVLSGILAKLLLGERKISRVIIQGVEAADVEAVKVAVAAAANDAGISGAVDRRVQAVVAQV